MGKITKTTISEALRFCIVGATAVAIQYGVYLLLLTVAGHNTAFVVGYLVSFVFNFFSTVFFTFKTNPNLRKALGFALSHVVNFVLQWALLLLFIHLGVPKSLAMIAVFAICVPTNFLLVRHFVKG